MDQIEKAIERMASLVEGTTDSEEAKAYAEAAKDLAEARKYLRGEERIIQESNTTQDINQKSTQIIWSDWRIPVVTGVFMLLGMCGVLLYEEKDVISSKAFNWVKFNL